MGGIWGVLVGSTGRRAPFAPAAPTASSPNANQDNISWVAPNNGGSPITLYYWESNDGKSGNTASTSAVVSQEAGTSQTYRVRAENAVGLGEWSPYSAQITTTFSFSPFGFTPFGFAPTSGSGSVCSPPCRAGGFCVGSGTCVY